MRCSQGPAQGSAQSLRGPSLPPGASADSRHPRPQGPSYRVWAPSSDTCTLCTDALRCPSHPRKGNGAERSPATSSQRPPSSPPPLPVDQHLPASSGPCSSPGVARGRWQTGDGGGCLMYLTPWQAQLSLDRFQGPGLRSSGPEEFCRNTAATSLAESFPAAS